MLSGSSGLAGSDATGGSFGRTAPVVVKRTSGRSLRSPVRQAMSADLPDCAGKSHIRSKQAPGPIGIVRRSGVKASQGWPSIAMIVGFQSGEGDEHQLRLNETEKPDPKPRAGRDFLHDGRGLRIDGHNIRAA